MKHLKTFESSLNEADVTDSNLEIIGPNVSELLDALDKLNGAQFSELSGNAFVYRDNIRLNPVDKTGHVISNNEFYLETIPQKIKSPSPDTNTYLRAANSFLAENGFDCKMKLNFQ